MPKLATTEPHLTVSELQERFPVCDDAAEKIPWHPILLRQQGRSTAEVADICGHKTDWVRRLVRRYNKKGPESMRDGRRNNLALDFFAKAAGASAAKRVVLIVDRADWHTSKKLKTPEGLHLLP